MLNGCVMFSAQTDPKVNVVTTAITLRKTDVLDNTRPEDDEDKSGCAYTIKAFAGTGTPAVSSPTRSTQVRTLSRAYGARLAWQSSADVGRASTLC